MLSFVTINTSRRFFLALVIFGSSFLFTNDCNCSTRRPFSPTPRRPFSPTPNITRSNTPDIVVRSDMPDIIVDHDSGVDDVISCLLQMKFAIIKQRRSAIRPANFRVKAFTISPADSFRKPAAWVMKRLVNLALPLASFRIPIGLGVHKGQNPFPENWREDAWKLTELKVWGDTPVSREEVLSYFDDANECLKKCLKEGVYDEKALSSFDGRGQCLMEGVYEPLDVLSQVLMEASAPVDILETGPCTNLAELLINYPGLKDKINRVYMMGGAVRVGGNVKEVPGHDGSAEWNIYNNPEAFKILLSSGVPITLVALDATQYTPIRKEFQAELKRHCEEKSFQLVSESLNVIQFLIDIGQYMFWDTLTSAVTIKPEIVTTEHVYINVVLDGPSTGRTFEVKDSKNGYAVDLAVEANQEMFENVVFETLFAKR